MIEETWLPVVGYESHYRVSNHGRVQRISSTRMTASKGWFLKPSWAAKRGSVYPRVNLWVDGGQVSFRIHKLVFNAFHGPLPDGMEVNHKDGNKLNPHADNLEAVTHARNVEHAIETGIFDQKGERNHQAKIDADIVSQIRAAYVPGVVGYIKLGRKFGLSAGHIRDIVKAKSWKHTA